MNDYENSEHAVFLTPVSDGTTISRLQGDGEFTSRIISMGYMRFIKNKGPITSIQLGFVPCIRQFLSTEPSGFVAVNLSDIPSADVTPKSLLETPEILYPFANRMSVACIMLHKIPGMLPDAYPKLEGKFPLEFIIDLNRFLQNPDNQEAVIFSKYGIDIREFAHHPDNRTQVQIVSNHTLNRIKRISESYLS